MCIILWTRCARIVGGARFDAQQLCVHRHFSVERCRPKRPHCRPWHGCSRAKPASRSRSDGDRRPAAAQASVGADRGDSSPGQDLLARTPAGPRCVPLPVGSLEPTLRLRWGRRGITIKPDGRRRPVALLPTPRFSCATLLSHHRERDTGKKPRAAAARRHAPLRGCTGSPREPLRLEHARANRGGMSGRNCGLPRSRRAPLTPAAKATAFLRFTNFDITTLRGVARRRAVVFLSSLATLLPRLGLHCPIRGGVDKGPPANTTIRRGGDCMAQKGTHDGLV